MYIGSLIAGYVQKMYTTGEGANAVTNWTNVWLVPAGIAAVVLFFYFVF